MFFSAIGGQPRLVVSDEERAIHAALKDLQTNREFGGYHIYDSYHIIHNIFKKLKKKEEIKYFSRIIHAKNAAEFAKNVKIAQDSLDSVGMRLLDHFLDHK